MSELETLESLFKIAGCINVELIPGSESNIDKKEFSWRLKEFSEEKIALDFEFENPDYISVDAVDKAKIVFSKTRYFMQTTDIKKSPTADDFTIIVDLPNQSSTPLYTEEEIESEALVLQILFISILSLSCIFKNSSQLLFGSIISLQVMAHLPLANIQLSATSKQSFKIMKKAVSFDLFPLTDLIDFEFTETDPWSTRFSTMGYKTINFIEGMGSITLFIWIGTICLIFAFLISYLCKKHNKKSQSA